MTWVTAADYRRGNTETGPAPSCQVFGKVDRIRHDLIVGAIARGSADARLSHIGAKTAVRAALSHLKTHSAELDAAVRTDQDDAVRGYFDKTLNTVLNSLRGAAFDQVASLEDLATSLIVFAVEPKGIAAMQIGDGLLVSRGQEADYQLIFDMDVRRRDDSTLFVTSKDAKGRMRVGIRKGPVSFLCAATEALGPLSLSNRNGRPHRRFFRPLDQYIQTAPDDGVVHQGIRSFLRSDRINRKLDDDLVLALCGYRSQGDLFMDEIGGIAE
jgi:hypothetical protein